MTMEASEDVTSEEDVTTSASGEIVFREVPSGDIYLTEERYDKNLVDCLLDIDEDLRASETLEDVVTQATIESLSAWAMTVPNPRYVPHVPKKKHAKSADDSAVTYHPLLNTEARNNAKFRKSFESDIRSSSQYRQCVEPTTYRYMPNNGIYRLSKVAPQDSSPSMNVRRMKCLDKYISPQQRVVQREVQRALRKEQELQHELKRETGESEKGITAIQEEKLQRDGTNFHESIARPCSPCETQELRRTTNEVSNNKNKDVERKVLQPKLHKPVELPPVEIPLLGKQISDKFIEKFSRRINALDEEMRKDGKVFRRNPEDMILNKSEPSRVTSQHMLDLRNVHKENVTDIKTIVSKHKWHKPIADDAIAQVYATNVDHMEIPNGYNSKDVSPRKDAVFYKVGSRDTERQNEETNFSSSISDFYNRQTTPGSDNSDTVLRHVQPRRTMSFDHNMIQKAKLHRDFRLSSQTHSQYVKKVTSSRTSISGGSSGKSIKVKPKEKSNSEVKTTFSNPPAKNVSNSFTAVPLGKSRHKETEQECYSQELLPGVAGKRLQMSVGNHRLL